MTPLRLISSACQVTIGWLFDFSNLWNVNQTNLLVFSTVVKYFCDSLTALVVSNDEFVLKLTVFGVILQLGGGTLRMVGLQITASWLKMNEGLVGICF